MNLFLLFFIFLCCQRLKAEGDGTCVIDEVRDEEWKNVKIIPDFEQNKGLNIFWHNETEIKNKPSCDFFAFTLDDTTINIKNAHDLGYLDNYDTYSISPQSFGCQDVPFDCGKVNNLTMSAGVLDTNDFPPEFSQPHYEITVPMPLIPKVDISVFMESPIQVRDKDFSNDKISVTIIPPDFEIETLKINGKPKTFNLKLSVNKLFRFDETKTYTLIAKDSGTIPGPRTANVTLKINVDYAASEPVVPKFSKSYYKMKYEIDKDGKGMLTPIDTIDVSATSDNIAVDIKEEDLKPYFSAKYYSSSKTVSVDLKNENLPDALLKNKKSLLLTLVGNIGKYTDTGDATIIINLPSNEDAPEFTETYYKYTFTEDGNLVPSANEITVTDKNADVTIEPSDQKYFTVTKKKDDGIIWNPVVKDADGLKKVESPEIAVKLQVKKNGVIKTNAATLLISLPVQQLLPRLDKSQYYGVYENGIVKLSNGPITVLNPQPEEVKLRFIGNYSDNFDVTSKDQKHYDVTVKSPPEEALKTETTITLQLEAKLNTVVTYSTVSLKLPEKVKPLFTQDNYVGIYDNKTGTVTFEYGPIALKSEDAKDTHVALSEGSDTNFQLQQSTEKENEYILSKKPNAVLYKKQYILNVRAELNSNVASATIIVNVPTEEGEIPHFKEINYQGVYLEDSGNIELKNGPIQLDNTNFKDTKVELMSEADKFDIAQKGVTNEWDVSLKSGVKLSPGTQYIVSLRAELNKLYGFTTLVVIYPAREVPEFSQPLYSVVINGSAVNGDQQIKLKNKNAKDTVVTLDDVGDKYFTIAKTSDPSIWKISVKKAPENSQEIDTVLKASLKDVFAYSTLSAQFKSDNGIVPEFSEAYYTGSYKTGKDKATVTIDKQIKIVSENPKEVDVRVSEDCEYKKYFTLNRQTDPSVWLIDVGTPLPENIIDKGGSITVILEAKQGNQSVKVPVVISLPEKMKPPVFDKANYEGEYKVKEDKKDEIVINNGPILVQNQGTIADLDIHLSGEYSDQITPVNSDGEVTLQVSSDLDIASMKNTFLVWTLDVSYKGSSEESSTTIVVSLPDNGSGKSNGQHGNDNGNDRTGLLVAVGVLVFIVIAGLVALAVVYYVKMRRKRLYNEMDDESVTSNDVRFSKNSKASSNGRKASSVANRRPTGFIRYSPTMKAKDDAEIEKETGENNGINETKERRKSVAFDENVAKLQIDPIEQHPEDVVTTQL